MQSFIFISFLYLNQCHAGLESQSQFLFTWLHHFRILLSSVIYCTSFGLNVYTNFHKKSAIQPCLRLDILKKNKSKCRMESVDDWCNDQGLLWLQKHWSQKNRQFSNIEAKLWFHFLSSRFLSHFCKYTS